MDRSQKYHVGGVRGAWDYIQALHIIAKQWGPGSFDHSYSAEKRLMKVAGPDALDAASLEHQGFTVRKISR
jgi:hypothetical protein